MKESGVYFIFLAVCHQRLIYSEYSGEEITLYYSCVKANSETIGLNWEPIGYPKINSQYFFVKLKKERLKKKFNQCI